METKRAKKVSVHYALWTVLFTGLMGCRDVFHLQSQARAELTPHVFHSAQTHLTETTAREYAYNEENVALEEQETLRYLFQVGIVVQVEFFNLG